MIRLAREGRAYFFCRYLFTRLLVQKKNGERKTPTFAEKAMALNDDISRILTSHLLRVKQGIAANMMQHGRMASGKSVASLRTEQTGDLRMALTGGPQWATMQKGRKAGKVPRNFRDIIKDWIRAKGISVSGGQKGLNSAAYLISRSIMKKGTRLYQRHGHDDIYDSVIEKEFNALTNDAINVVGAEIDKSNDNFVKP